MCILCQNCYNIRLEELEWREASQKNNSDQGGTKKCIKDHLGDLEGIELLITAYCPRHEIDIHSLELDKNFNWVTKKHNEKLKKYMDIHYNPGRNLVDFFIPEECHNCKGIISMIDGLSVKKSNLWCKKELMSEK